MTDMIDDEQVLRETCGRVLSLQEINEFDDECLMCYNARRFSCTAWAAWSTPRTRLPTTLVSVGVASPWLENLSVEMTIEEFGDLVEVDPGIDEVDTGMPVRMGLPKFGRVSGGLF